MPNIVQPVPDAAAVPAAPAAADVAAFGSTQLDDLLTIP